MIEFILLFERMHIKFIRSTITS